ncbi:creatinine amidohydrolase [Lachnospiraceae bacterium KM106-2]|nr:creatinine amidohydrolase [Lachnospiraceae bacterium KM106-2]
MGRNILEHTMLEMTWCEVEELAKKDAVVLLPVGVVEEHSRHLPLGTDIYVAAAQAKDIKEEMDACGFPCIIAPPFYFGAIGALSKLFPGSFNSSKETISKSLWDLLESLENAGFKRVVAINGHGDPLHRSAITQAFQSYNQEHELKAKWMTFEDDLTYEGFDGTEDFVLAVPPYPFDKLVTITGEIKDQNDYHAGAFETAIMRDLFPELVHMEKAVQMDATMLQGEQLTKWQAGKKEDRSLLPDGHVGDPAASVHITTDLIHADQAIAHGIMDYYTE